MIDSFVNDGSLKVIASKIQRNLRKKGGYHRPMRLNVVYVIKEQSANCNIFEIVKSSCCRSLSTKLSSQLVVVRMVCQWDVG